MKEMIQSDIDVYMFSNAVPATLLFILILLYFPSSPSIPPSISSHQTRLDFLSGFKELLTNRSCWLVSIGCSMPQGISVAWTAMMVINLTEVCEEDGCLTQHWVNYLGIYTTVASTLAAIGVARLADKIKGRLKEAIILLLTFSAIIFMFLSLISVGVFRFGHIINVQVLVYILLITGWILNSELITLISLITRNQSRGLQYASCHGVSHGAVLSCI